MDGVLERRLSELYMSNIDIICEGLPSYINLARRGFLENFNLLGLPSKRSERYRHCDMRELFSGEWEHYFTPPMEARVSDRLSVEEGYKIDVVNGFCGDGERLTTLESGIVYGSLRAAMCEMPEVVGKYYGSVADADGESVVALNSLFTQDGAFVYVPSGVRAEDPFVLTFEYSSQEQAQMCFSRALIVLEDGAEANVIVSHQSAGDASFLIDHVRETTVGERARLNLTEISGVSKKSKIVEGSYLTQGADSSVDVMSLWLEGGATRANIVTNMVGERCESNLWGLYFGADDERVDINLTANHLAPNCDSYEMIKGVVSGSGVGAFTGRIYVAREAQKTNAFQQNRNLQLSEGGRIYTEPQLEIYADDVKCSHGATIGQLDVDAIYYMRQRGLSEQDAKRLQLYGFVNDVISRCPTEQVCEFARELVEVKVRGM